MVKRCLLVLALATAHSPVAPCIAGAATPAMAPGTATLGRRSHAAADKYQALRAEAAAALSARSDANSLATAAALRYGAGAGYGAKTAGLNLRPSALELAARASELAPQDASIGWLHLQLCSGTPTCDIRDVATVLRWVDADNGAAWLQTLAAAQKDRDATEVDRILADMARAARFDFYWNRIVVLMVDALEAARDQLPGGLAGSPSARLTTVSGVAGG